MLGSHYFDKAFELDQATIPLQDSSHYLDVRIKSLFSQEFEDFQMDNFGFHDRIYDWLEASYIESPFSNSKL